MNKKKISALMLALLIGLCGCGGEKQEKKEPKTEPKKEVEKPSAETNQLQTEKTETDMFLETYINTDERPIAVMIDNDDEKARPQAGLNEAYLIYEMVIEGGATRFMALYRGADVEKIGPVRSSRHYYLDYALENDAIYTHYGWSPKAMQDISSLGVRNINGLTEDDGILFWRERKYRGDWHSAYTNIEQIKKRASAKGYEAKTEHKGGIKYSDSHTKIGTGNGANEVILKYSGKYTTGYIYNEEKGVYEKSINGSLHLMQNGEGVEVENIIIQLISDTSLGDGSDRRNIKTFGSGKGYYITGGEIEEIAWTKASRGENTVYKKSDGTELLVNPGKTIVNIISPSATITVK